MQTSDDFFAGNDLRRGNQFSACLHASWSASLRSSLEIKMNPLIILGLIMAIYSIVQYSKYRQRSRLMFAIFWSLLALDIATGLSILMIPSTIFLLVGIYYKCYKKDGLMEDADKLLREAGVTNAEFESYRNENKEKKKLEKLKELEKAEKEKDEESKRVEFEAIPINGYRDINIHNNKEAAFPTDTGQQLLVGTGEIEASIKMSFHPERSEDDEIDTIIFDVQLTDNTGVKWECRSFLQPYLMTETLEADTSDPSSGFIHWSEIHSAWKQAIKQNCLIAGVNNLLDGRDSNELKVGDTTYHIYFKYQGPRIDVGYLDASSSFIIRISGLYHDIYEGDKFIDKVEMPPFCFAMPSEQFLFISAPEYYYSYYEEWYAIDEGKEKKPLLFRKIQEQGVPQPHVRMGEG